MKLFEMCFQSIAHIEMIKTIYIYIFLTVLWPNEYEKSLLAASRYVTQNIAANDEADHSNNTNNDKVQDEAVAAENKSNYNKPNKDHDEATLLQAMRWTTRQTTRLPRTRQRPSSGKPDFKERAIQSSRRGHIPNCMTRWISMSSS